MFYKSIIDGYVLLVSPDAGDVAITESEYNELHYIIHNRPSAPDGYDYKLRADNLEWELVELPPVEDDPELTADEALDIILGGERE